MPSGYGSTAMSLTVSGDNKYRVFEIGSGTTVTMTNMTLANGDLSGGDGRGPRLRSGRN